MASSIRLPVDYNTSVLGVDYGYVDLWEAATDGDLVTATKGELLLVPDDAASYALSASAFSQAAFTGATVNASYFRAIIYDPTNITRPYITHGYLNTLISEDYFGWHVDFAATFTGGTAKRAGLSLNACANAKIANCSVKSSWTGVKSESVTGDCFFINVLTYECGDDGVNVNSVGHTTYCYNVTSVDNAGYGFQQRDGTAIAKNCISEDNTSGQWDGTWTTKQTCTDNDGVVFADQANDDYSLASSDTVARGNGTDLSADGVFAFDDDLLENTRVAWDIGAYEYQATNTKPVIGTCSTTDITSTSAKLVAPVTDADGDACTVTFYEASDDSVLGTDTGVASGSNAELELSGLDPFTTYEWYAVPNDGTEDGDPGASVEFTTLSEAESGDGFVEPIVKSIVESIVTQL